MVWHRHSRTALRFLIATLAPIFLAFAVYAQSSAVKIVGYYPDWNRASYPHTAIPYQHLTHVAHSFLIPNADGSLRGTTGFAYPALWEMKCLGAKSWRELQKQRVAVAKPVYAAQVAIYQAYLQLHENPALFTALNADSMEIYAECVPFDAALAQRMSDRGLKVITATEAGELLPRSFADSTHVECRLCAWQDRCWRVA